LSVGTAFSVRERWGAAAKYFMVGMIGGGHGELLDVDGWRGGRRCRREIGRKAYRSTGEITACLIWQVEDRVELGMIVKWT
jgi:hypothetical protein